MRHAALLEDFAQGGDGSSGAVVLCHLQERRRRRFFGCGDECAAQLGTDVPGSCGAGLIYGDSERGTAADGEHGDYAAQRVAHDADPFGIGKRQRAKIIECREHVIGLRLHPCNEPLPPVVGMASANVGPSESP